MHDTAYAVGRAFFQSYVRAGDGILEIGSFDVNGSLRDFCPAGSHYVGVDLAPGPSVEIVAPASQLPFPDETFDAVVSSSCFEHDSMFWLTFLEISRVVKRGGYIYINAPSRGDYHTFPIDAWRFFPDAGMALSAWARRSGYAVDLFESFISEGDDFGDCVMVFGKGAEPPPILLARRCPDILNVRTWPDTETLARRTHLWPRRRATPSAAAVTPFLGEPPRFTEEMLGLVQSAGASVRRCLEWSGGGTVLIAEYAQSNGAEFFLSIDHIAQRQRQVLAHLPKYPLMHCRLIGGEDTPRSPGSEAADIAYITYPLGLGVEFDVIVVAGRWRLQCALAAALMVAPGGLVIVLDDEQRRDRTMRRFFDDDDASVAADVVAVLDKWRDARCASLRTLYDTVEEKGDLLVLRAKSKPPGARRAARRATALPAARTVEC